jgi:hypothetical protein
VRSPQPPLEYLATCSQGSLEGFELARLDQISHLRTKLRDIHEEWIEAEVAARLARLLLDGRRAEARGDTGSSATLDSRADIRRIASASAPPHGAHSHLAERFSPSLFHRECSERPGQRPPEVAALVSPPEGAARPQRPEPPGDEDVSVLLLKNDARPPASNNADVGLIDSPLSGTTLRQPAPSRAQDPHRPARGSHVAPTGDRYSSRNGTAGSLGFLGIRIRLSRQLPLFRARENKSPTQQAHPIAHTGPRGIAVPMLSSGLVVGVLALTPRRL